MRELVERTATTTVICGFVNDGGQPVPAEYVVRRRLGDTHALRYARSIDPSFMLTDVKYRKDRYTMPLDKFLEAADYNEGELQ